MKAQRNLLFLCAGLLVASAVLGLATPSWAQAPAPNVIAASASPETANTGQAVQFVARTDRPAAMVLLQFPDLSTRDAIRLHADATGTVWSYQAAMMKPNTLRFTLLAFDRAGHTGRTSSGVLRVQGAPVADPRAHAAGRRSVQSLDVGGFFNAIGVGIQQVGDAIVAGAEGLGQAVANLLQQPPAQTPPPASVTMPPPPSVHLTDTAALNNASPLANAEPMIGNNGAALVANTGASLTSSAAVVGGVSLANVTPLRPGYGTLGLSDRPSVIRQAFQQAFGRDPSAAELQSWLNLPRGDAKLTSTDALVSTLQRVLRSPMARSERQNMIVRAFRTELQRDPNGAELAQWDQQVSANLTTYAALLTAIAPGASQETILASYRAAFGREPAPNELQYWLAVPGTDPRVHTPAALVTNHRGFLRASEPERRATAIRAFETVFRRDPSARELGILTNRVASSGDAYEDLVNSLRIISPSYTTVFGRAPVENEMDYWLSVPAADPRVRDQDALVLNHENFLKSNAPERRATVLRAFRSALQRDPAEAELAKWDAQVANQGYTYTLLTCLIKPHHRGEPGCFGGNRGFRPGTQP